MPKTFINTPLHVFVSQRQSYVGVAHAQREEKSQELKQILSADCPKTYSRN